MARKPESIFWDQVRPLLAGLDPVRIENGAGIGTPDVNITLGWIELKQVTEPPKRADTVLKLDHFTPEQRVFLVKRHKAGGSAWLLLKLGQEWLLFKGDVAAWKLGRLTASQTRDWACRRWTSTPDWREFQAALHETR